MTRTDPPDTIVANQAFFLSECEADAASTVPPSDGYPHPLSCPCVRVDWVDDHMFGGSSGGTRYVVDRRVVEEWERMSLARLPLVVSARNIVREVPLHFRGMYARDADDSYVLREPWVRDWGKR